MRLLKYFMVLSFGLTLLNCSEPKNPVNTNSSAIHSSSSGTRCSDVLDQGEFRDARDDRDYRWTKIGDQTWMAENLAYLPSVNRRIDYSISTPMRYVYGYLNSNVSEAKATSQYRDYGVLYNWLAAKEDCPAGWHLPTESEWSELITCIGGNSHAAIKLKADSSLWIVNTGTNDHGFAALPGGNFRGGVFYDVGEVGAWWTLSPYDSTWAYNRDMGESDSTYSHRNYMGLGLSVRCVMDLE